MTAAALAPMRVYAALAAAGFRRQARYRTAVLASAFTNTVFGLIRASLMLTAVAAAGGAVAGYDAMQAVTYAWLSQAILGPIDVWGSRVEIGARIKSGDIAVDFQRPVSVVGASLATNYGRAALDLLPRGLPPLVIGFLFTGLRVPTSPTAWVAGALALIVAVALNHAFYFAVTLIGLWVLEHRGFLVLAMSVQQILSGFFVPVAWFPEWLKEIAHASPFPWMFQFPVDLLTERVTGGEAWTGLGVQLLWTVAMVGVCLLMLRAGRRKVVIQGG